LPYADAMIKFSIIIRAHDVIRQRGYCDLCHDVWVCVCGLVGVYEGRSISFDPGYLGLYFWAEKCCRPDLLTVISVL